MPEKKGYLWDPMYGILPDVDPVYYDDSLTEPAVVSAPLPAKFNGSQEAARRYAEGYRLGRENVRDPREQVAPIVETPQGWRYEYGDPDLPFARGGLLNRLRSHYGSDDKVLEAVREFKKGGDKTTLNHPKYNAAKERPMYDYLRYRGLGAPQASGMLGNLAVESWLNADLQQQGGGPAYGLMQAEASRQTAMKNYDGSVYQFGSNLSPEEQQQLDYIIDKGVDVYTPGEWGRKNFKGARDARAAFINADDVRTASDIVTNNFLRPGKPHIDRRRAMSEYYYDKYNSEAPYGEGFLWGNAPGFDFSAGGKIRIKPENRGKFTALKKRTGHSASWFKAHGTPAQKKMAVFALNARKWKHGDGGLIERYGADAIRAALVKMGKI